MLIEEWTGRVIGTLHVHGLAIIDLANYMGITNSYASAVLNGKRSPKGAKERFLQAVDSLVVAKERDEIERKGENQGGEPT